MAPSRIDLGRPHPLFGARATRRIEQAALALLAPHTLMQRAGLAVARLALALAPHSRAIWIACGPGNNGGDGFEAAHHLARWGKHPVITWLGDEQRLPSDARAALERARQAGVTMQCEPPELAPGDLAIDALLGIGAARPPEGRMREWLLRMNSGVAPVLAVDLPSGLDADSGMNALDSIAENSHWTGGEGIFSSHKHTLSLLTLKPGLFTAHGRDAAGCVWFDDLGCDPLSEPRTAELLGAPAPLTRPHSSHKGTFGDVAVIGSARGMGGAVLLAGSAALHSGAGKVFVCPLDGGALALDPTRPELMFRSPTEVSFESCAVVCGCGGGDAVAGVLPEVLARAARLVLDADALNAIAGDGVLQRALIERGERGQPTVLTPHPLEAARLLSTSASQIQADRLSAAQRLADRFGCTVVLKGSGTVIAERGRCPAICPTGNAKLATAGTGDVLAGMIGAELAARAAAGKVAPNATGHGPAWNATGNAAGDSASDIASKPAAGKPATAASDAVEKAATGAAAKHAGDAAGKAVADAAWNAACAAVYRHGLAADSWPAGQPLTAGRLARIGASA